ncbi:hypothetical protein AXK61_14665 [Tsukamurella pseudospumae]|uniref:Uncharacterized protein n=1 Tax=Tsukamurella pseudospumae TaxID=239498 RepID=A0A137ZR67_9ACTN|nr:hypothetical protein AXK61_14665 [Tsukamurella pseudospumae]
MVLVLGGHEHHYERSRPVRGTLGNEPSTPRPVDPGTSGGRTTMKRTYHAVTPAGMQSADSFLLTRPRRSRHPPAQLVAPVP